MGASPSLELDDLERELTPDLLAERILGPLLREIGSPALSDWPPSQLQGFSALSFEELLSAQGASRGAARLLGDLGFAGLVGDGPAETSGLQILRFLGLMGGPGEILAVRGGNDLLPRAMAERLREKTRYGAHVLQISQDGGGVRALYRQGGRVTSTSGDWLICALPFSTLREIDISPALSDEKRSWVEKLGYTSVSRVYLQTRDRAWAPDGRTVQAITDTPLGWIEDHTFGREGPRAIVEAHTAGERARHVAAMEPDSRWRFALRQMDELFPDIARSAESGTSLCWDEEPWSRGAYAWVAPADYLSYFPAVRAPEGRFFFAGEHTSPWMGSMNGALQSGVRAATELASRIRDSAA